MKIIPKNLKAKIFKDLKQIITRNKEQIDDIWIYGSFKDSTSDLDLILIYKIKPPIIKFPDYINALVADGNIIYLNKLNKKKLFLFEKLNIYSIKKKKKYTIIYLKNIINLEIYPLLLKGIIIQGYL